MVQVKEAMPAHESRAGLSDNGTAAQPTAHIVICDESAIFYHMHQDAFHAADAKAKTSKVFDGYARTIKQLSLFNTANPLFGGQPVSVLVPSRALRVHNANVRGCLCTTPIPEGSFIELREGLYVASPEFAFARMANRLSEAALAEVGINLCARYYYAIETSAIVKRKHALVTPDQIARYLQGASVLRGCKAAQKALRWVVSQSASPMETKTYLQFCLPLRMGGFALPFTSINYDVYDRRYPELCEQGFYSIDLAAPKLKVGLEYDGLDYHQEVSKDRRRRNALRALGWEVFPVDSGILYNAAATEVLAGQIARHLGIRLRKPKGWEEKFARLRIDLGLDRG